MIDEVLKHLELASRFEENAKRLVEAEDRGPHWLTTYKQCLRDARRERALAREASRKRGRGELNDANCSPGTRVSDLNGVTVGQILRWATIIRSSSVGTSRLRRTAIRMMAVAETLEEANVIDQLMWWATDVAPVPPGRPSARPIDLDPPGTPVQIDEWLRRSNGTHDRRR